MPACATVQAEIACLRHCFADSQPPLATRFDGLLKRFGTACYSANYIDPPGR